MVNGSIASDSRSTVLSSVGVAYGSEAIGYVDSQNGPVSLYTTSCLHSNLESAISESRSGKSYLMALSVLPSFTKHKVKEIVRVFKESRFGNWTVS